MLPRPLSGNILARHVLDPMEKLTLEERIERIKRKTKNFSVHNMASELERKQKKSRRHDGSSEKRKRGCCGGRC
jgi:hypothetical protein